MEAKLQFTNPRHEAFLRVMMNAKRTGPIRISRDNELGKYITSRVRYSNLPVRQSSGTIVHLPKTTLETAANYYLYFTVEDQKKINDHIASEFSLHFRSYMLIGGEYNIEKKKLIEAFINTFNLHNFPTVFENLKKSDYRNRKKLAEFVKNSVQTLV